MTSRRVSLGVAGALGLLFCYLVHIRPLFAQQHHDPIILAGSHTKPPHAARIRSPTLSTVRRGRSHSGRGHT
jgi:hypothetical protein